MRPSLKIEADQDPAMIGDNATQTTKGLKDAQEKIEEEDLIAEAVWLAEERLIADAEHMTDTALNVETYLEDNRLL